MKTTNIFVADRHPFTGGQTINIRNLPHLVEITTAFVKKMGISVKSNQFCRLGEPGLSDHTSRLGNIHEGREYEVVVFERPEVVTIDLPG